MEAKGKGKLPLEDSSELPNRDADHVGHIQEIGKSFSRAVQPLQRPESSEVSSSSSHPQKEAVALSDLMSGWNIDLSKLITAEHLGIDLADKPNRDSYLQQNVYVEELPPVIRHPLYKTELCNNWRVTSDCPYKHRCHYAHGVEELAPVIRHPRYKTELCNNWRMNSDCPYKHRCHYAHGVEEKQLAGGRK